MKKNQIIAISVILFLVFSAIFYFLFLKKEEPKFEGESFTTQGEGK